MPWVGEGLTVLQLNMLHENKTKKMLSLKPRVSRCLNQVAISFN